MVVLSSGIGNTLTRQITGGWQIAPIFTAYSGQPFTVTNGGQDISKSGKLLDRPNILFPSAVIPDQRTGESVV